MVIVALTRIVILQDRVLVKAVLIIATLLTIKHWVRQLVYAMQGTQQILQEDAQSYFAALVQLESMQMPLGPLPAFLVQMDPVHNLVLRPGLVVVKDTYHHIMWSWFLA